MVFRSFAVTLGAVTLATPDSNAALLSATTIVGGLSSYITFDSLQPQQLLSVKANYDGQFFAGIDFRPQDAQLFGLLAPSDIYVLDPVDGRRRTNGLFPDLNLSGVHYGFDANPTIERVTIVSDSGMNVSLDPMDANTLVMRPNLHYSAGDTHFGAAVNVVNIAYTNNFRGALSTQLYGIDTGLDALVLIDEATGGLTTVGPLGVNVAAVGGFDIAQDGTAFAALVPAGAPGSRLFTVNLANGAAADIGEIGGGFDVYSLAAFIPVPEPSTAMLLATCALIVGRCTKCRRRKAVYKS